MACSGVPGLGNLISDEAGSMRFGFGPGGVIGWTTPSVGVITPVLAAGLAGLRAGWLSFVFLLKRESFLTCIGGPVSSSIFFREPFFLPVFSLSDSDDERCKLASFSSRTSANVS